MTHEQRIVVRDYMIAEHPDFDADIEGFGGMAIWLNEPAEPEYLVWKTVLPIHEVTDNGFVWIEVPNINAGRARIWDWMRDTEHKTINPSKENVREGLDRAFENSTETHAGIQPHLRRPARRAEALLADGAGTFGAPGMMGWEGTVSPTLAHQIYTTPDLD